MTKFEIEDAYVAQFAVHVVGDSYHQELWIPAEALDIFNQHIIGYIQVINEFSEKK